MSKNYFPDIVELVFFIDDMPESKTNRLIDLFCEISNPNPNFKAFFIMCFVHFLWNIKLFENGLFA